MSPVSDAQILADARALAVTLKQAARTQGLSQSHLADQSACSLATIGRLLNGDGAVGLFTAAQAAGALGYRLLLVPHDRSSSNMQLF